MADEEIVWNWDAHQKDWRREKKRYNIFRWEKSNSPRNYISRRGTNQDGMMNTKTRQCILLIAIAALGGAVQEIAHLLETPDQKGDLTLHIVLGALVGVVALLKQFPRSENEGLPKDETPAEPKEE